MKYLPLPDVNVDNGSANYTRTSLIKSSGTQQYAGKLEHKFTDKISLTGFYLWDGPDTIMDWWLHSGNIPATATRGRDFSRCPAFMWQLVPRTLMKDARERPIR